MAAHQEGSDGSYLEDGANVEEEDEEAYNPLFVKIYHVLKDGKRADVYTPLFSRDEISFRAPSFELPQVVDALPATLAELFWPDKVLDGIVECTNLYARDHASATRFKPTNRSEILRFIATVTYMGVVKLQDKEDYWPNDDLLPRHQTITIDKWRFMYLWKYIHTCYAGNHEEDGVVANQPEEMDAEPAPANDPYPNYAEEYNWEHQ